MVEHPLFSEKKELKRKYIALICKYAEKYNEEFVELKLKTLCKAIFGNDEAEELVDHKQDLKEAETNVIKTRFSPFRFFSYRYVFLFDALFLFAIEDKEKGFSICEEFKKHVNARYHKKINTMVSLMYENNAAFAKKTLISDEMVQNWVDARNYVQTDNQDIFFTATMSAGKSTLINSIVGNNLSGTKKAACTSVVIKVHSIPIRGELYSISHGSKQHYFQNLNDVQQLVKEEKEDFEITGYFNSILSSGRFTLIDTPGVDSILYPEHRTITRNALTKHEIETLVYVIPVETYGSDRDVSHLTFIKRKVSYDRIIFVINMMDTIDEEDDSIDDIITDVKEHLENLGFDNPQVYPVSAKAGLKLKQYLVGKKLTNDELDTARDYCQLFQKKEYGLAKYYCPITDEEKNILTRKIYKNFSDSYWEAFINTGIPGLENILYKMNRKDV